MKARQRAEWAGLDGIRTALYGGVLLTLLAGVWPRYSPPSVGVIVLLATIVAPFWRSLGIFLTEPTHHLPPLGRWSKLLLYAALLAPIVLAGLRAYGEGGTPGGYLGGVLTALGILSGFRLRQALRQTPEPPVPVSSDFQSERVPSEAR